MYASETTRKIDRIHFLIRKKTTISLTLILKKKMLKGELKRKGIKIERGYKENGDIKRKGIKREKGYKEKGDIKRKGIKRERG